MIENVNSEREGVREGGRKNVKGERVSTGRERKREREKVN